jgi:hypothetical protein
MLIKDQKVREKYLQVWLSGHMYMTPLCGQRREGPKSSLRKYDVVCNTHMGGVLKDLFIRYRFKSMWSERGVRNI